MNHLENFRPLACEAFDFAQLNWPGCPASFMIARPSTADVPAALAGIGCAGAGLSPSQAMAAVLGEAAEVWSLCRHGDEATVFAPRSQLPARSIAPNDLLMISPRQYAQRSDWNRVFSELEPIPDPWTDDMPIHWMRGTDLAGEPVMVPAAYGLRGAHVLDPRPVAFADSNGCAAGPSFDEAVSRACLELIERDAAALWWHGGYGCPEVRLEGSALGPLAPLVAWLRARERRFHVLDLTTELGIHVLAAVSATADGQRVAIGLGAGFSGASALAGALLEMLQSELGIAFEAARPPDASSLLQRWCRAVDLRRCPQLRPRGVRALDSMPSLVEGTGSARWIRPLAERHGLDVIILDLTREAIGVPVARVCIPGLRPLKTRLAPGRLYDMPQRLGWQRVVDTDAPAFPLVA